MAQYVQCQKKQEVGSLILYQLKFLTKFLKHTEASFEPMCILLFSLQ